MKNSDKNISELDFVISAKKQFHADLLIIDYYDIKEKDISELSKQIKILFFDDFQHLDFYDVDYIVNVNYYSKPLSYKTKKTCKVLLGPEYFILREQIKNAVRNRKDNNFNLVITLGASDYQNLNYNIIKTLIPLKKEKKDLNIILITTKMQDEKNLKKLKELEKKIKIYYSPENFADLIASAGLAICNGGLTKYELAYLGVPAVGIAQIEHQEILLKNYEHLGALVYAGVGKNLDLDNLYNIVHDIAFDKKKLNQMSNAGKKIIDGNGGDRIVNYINAFQ